MENPGDQGLQGDLQGAQEDEGHGLRLAASRGVQLLHKTPGTPHQTDTSQALCHIQGNLSLSHTG